MGEMYSQSSTILKHIKLIWAVMPQIVCFSIQSFGDVAEWLIATDCKSVP